VDIRLRPLHDDEFEEFLAAQHVEYARGLVDEAGMSPEAAVEKARADLASLFPEGVREPDHRIAIVEDVATGEPAGRVFWAPRRDDRAYVYDLFIEERFCGQGLGRRALELLEADAREAGFRGVDLNVWGGNDVARALYRTAGYDERAVFMSKELD
jgi:ribosomal protein S18 acetylase RimI-like enzyme